MYSLCSKCSGSLPPEPQTQFLPPEASRIISPPNTHSVIPCDSSGKSLTQFLSPLAQLSQTWDTPGSQASNHGASSFFSQVTLPWFLQQVGIRSCTHHFLLLHLYDFFIFSFLFWVYEAFCCILYLVAKIPSYRPVIFVLQGSTCHFSV